MSLFKPTGSSIWYYGFRRGGRSFRGSTKETDKTRARAVYRAETVKAEQQIRAERDAARRPMTVEQCFTFYADEVLAHQPTKAQGERELFWLLDQLGRDKGVGELTNADLTALTKARRACLRRCGADEKGRPIFKPVAPATVNRTLEVLRAALWYVRDHHDAFLRPLKFKKLAEPKERVREASAAEETAIFAELREDFHDVVQFALLTGIRLSGCVTLVWPNVDFDHQVIRYRKKRKAGAPEQWDVVPMTAESEAILRRQLGRHKTAVWTYVSEGKKGGKGGTGRTGEYEAGKRYPITFWGLQTRWRRALAKAGVSDFRFHDLRHTAATRWVRTTGNLKVAQKLLGHASVTTTAKYAHVQLDDLRAALERTEAVARSRNSDAESQGFSQGPTFLKIVE